MKKLIKFFLGKKIGQSFYRFLFLAGLKGMNFGGGSDFKESGEKWVLEYLSKKFAGSKPVVFDVGANLGGYSTEATTVFKKHNLDFTIFAFEPSKKTFELLEKKVSGEAKIKVFNMALGKEPGELLLHSNEEGSGLASLFDRDLKSRGIVLQNSEKVLVETLDSFCQKNSIINIDFLKLDVEGFEYNVLLGAKEFLEKKKIKYIQFEFGGTDIDARVFFKDFYNLLSPNYKISRILKNGLAPVLTYDETHEIFMTTNYLSERKD